CATHTVVFAGVVVGPGYGEQGRRLGQPVDLDELPAELALQPFDERRRRRRAGDGEARPRADRVLRLVRVVEDGAQHGGRHAGEGDALVGTELIDPLRGDSAQGDGGSAQ